MKSEDEILMVEAAEPKKQRATFLPFALPDIGETELAEIKEALESGWITTGPKTKQFENEFADAVGAKHAIAVNSCTAAMHLALEAIGLKPGPKLSRHAGGRLEGCGNTLLWIY